MLWPSYDQTLIQCCRQGFCTWNHAFCCFIFLTKVLKLRTWALERRMYHCCWWRMAFLRALSASPALCSPSLSTTVVFWISSLDAYQTLRHSTKGEGLSTIFGMLYCIMYIFLVIVDCCWTDPRVILFTFSFLTIYVDNLKKSRNICFWPEDPCHQRCSVGWLWLWRSTDGGTCKRLASLKQHIWIHNDFSKL